jgi:ligand-binding sensor domain-containing protein/tRNA A-37 threonylcarbamoyl transferase component Bud32
LLRFAGSLLALDPQKKITQYTLGTWKTERGLPNNSVLAITQDCSGYLWIGTVDGLVRFDGVVFKVFNSRNTAEFHDDFVNNLFVDGRGILWIGTTRGELLSLEQGRFRNHALAANVSGMSSDSIVEDSQGDLWVGTFAGLFRRPFSGAGVFSKCLAFPGVPINCLGKDRSGRLLVSTEKYGLQRLERQQWRPVLSVAAPRNSNIFVFRQDRHGNFWLGTDDELYRYRDDRLFRYSAHPGLRTNITALCEDRDGNLWIGSEGGLFRWPADGFPAMEKGLGFAGTYVYSVSEDAEGSLWIGAVEGGLTQIRDEKMTTLTNSEGLPGDKFRCLHADDSGALWIAGNGGYLTRFHHGRCEKFALPARFKGKAVYSLERDLNDSFWLGTESGLLLFKDRRFREVSLPGRPATIGVRCVLKDRTGRLWVGTWGGGLLCRDNGRFLDHFSDDGLPANRISSLFEDRRGNIWVGCENGLAVRKPDGSGHFSQEPFFDDCLVASFYEDARGVMWVGTHQGLKVLRNGHWGSLASDQGLFDNRAYAIMEDGLGNLWMSSERGIFRANKMALEKAAFDRNLKVSGRLFDENDGMKSRIGNFGSPAGWKDASGRLWFANLAGVVSIDPAHVRKNGRVPPVLVEAVTVDNRGLPVAGNSAAAPVQLAAGSKRFGFKYTALSFIRSDRIRFKYKLEGYDREWTDAGNRREAFYNDLKPGRYRFLVIAANADGVWNTAGAAFAFRLRSFVYQTWWFMALALLAFAVLSGLSWQLLQKYLRAVSFWKKRTHIGHFRILETIGTGGMATVFRAQDMLAKKRIVALKVLREESFHDEAQKQRFRHEARITEGLEHPHIVRVLERGEANGDWYIAMELLPGQPLSRLLRDGGRLAVAAALDVMLQVVDALGAIHAREIVHRDLKPENIMIDERPGRRRHVTLLDFGLAITPAQSRLTMSGVVMGTIRYLPPERIEEGVSSPAGDIYSSGVILYEMLTGSKPFWSEATGEVIHRILETYPVPAREIVPAVPLELDALIAAMIDKDPARRPSLAALENELRRLAAASVATPEAPDG